VLLAHLFSEPELDRTLLEICEEKMSVRTLSRKLQHVLDCH